MGTDIEDPARSLKTIACSTKQAKDQLVDLPQESTPLQRDAHGPRGDSGARGDDRSAHADAVHLQPLRLQCARSA